MPKPLHELEPTINTAEPEFLEPLSYKEAAIEFNFYLEMMRDEGLDDQAISHKLTVDDDFRYLSPLAHEPLVVFISKFGNDVDLPFNANGPVLELSYSREFMDALLNNGGERFIAINDRCFLEAGTEIHEEDIHRLLAVSDADEEVIADIYEAVCSMQSTAVHNLGETHFLKCLELKPETAYESMDIFGLPKDQDMFLKFATCSQKVAEKLLDDYCAGKVFSDIEMTTELTYTLARAGVVPLISHLKELETAADENLATVFVTAGLGQQVLKQISQFNNISLNFALELINSAEHKNSFPPAAELKKIEGIEFNSEFAHTLIKTKAGTDWLLDDNIDEFYGLSLDHVLAIINSGRPYDLEPILTESDRFNGFKINREFAELLVSSRGGLANLSSNLEYFFDLGSPLLEKLLNFNPDELVDEYHALGATALRSEWRPDREKFLLEHLFRFQGISQEVIDGLFEFESGVEAFPGGGTVYAGWSRQQNEWFGRNRYTEELFGANWTNEKLGEIIGLRIRLGLESTLHDASYWLDNFKTEDSVKNVNYILENRFNEDFNAANLPEIKIFDNLLEKLFIQNIIYFPLELRRRLNLSAKPDSETILLDNKDVQITYRTLINDYQGEPLYKSADLSKDLLLKLISERFSDGTYLTDDFEGSTTAQEIVEGVNYLLTEDCSHVLAEVMSPADLQRQGPRIIGNAIKELKRIGLARKQYINETLRWLKINAASDHKQLVKVWSGRATALAYGVKVSEDGSQYAEVEDNIKSIVSWQNEAAFKQYVENEIAIASTGTSSEVLINRKKLFESFLIPAKADTRTELMRVLSVEHALSAMMLYHKWRNERPNDDPQLLSPQTTLVKRDRGNYTLEVLGKDDPRGFTIGEDTGCCMTIKGQSWNCIEAGYKYPNAGFVAMYKEQGALVAQSFWYVHPDFPDTLVIDNIEANKGRDLKRVLSVYTEGLTDLLNEHNKESKTKITQVNLGEGYSDIDLTALDVVTPIPKLYEEIYTDARKQRRIVNLT